MSDFNMRKEIPTVDKIAEDLKENIGYKGSSESLRRVLYGVRLW